VRAVKTATAARRLPDSGRLPFGDASGPAVIRLSRCPASWHILDQPTEGDRQFTALRVGIQRLGQRPRRSDGVLISSSSRTSRTAPTSSRRSPRSTEVASGHGRADPRATADRGSAPSTRRGIQVENLPHRLRGFSRASGATLGRVGPTPIPPHDAPIGELSTNTFGFARTAALTGGGRPRAPEHGGRSSAPTYRSRQNGSVRADLHRGRERISVRTGRRR
jgi:hypothetical protein